MPTIVVNDLPDPLIGRIIDGKYRVRAPLGEGGMAQVYTAEHLVLEHLVAIKFLRRELAVEPEIAERFAREAKTIAQLNSEHIVKVLDVGHLDGAGLFMVMEYLDGEDLQTRLGRIGPLPLAETIAYVIQAAEGLEQAHRKGIVHRDLKPENLFLARSQRGIETIKLLDFGISKQIGASLSRLTQPQVAIGSPNYMAPEQLMGHDNIDARADIWSLGVVLYRLTTGKLPFTGQSIAEVYARILHTEPVKPSRVCPGLPHAFDEIVMRCLKKPASERPPNVRALAAALRNVVSHGSRAPSVYTQVMGERSRSVDPVSITTRQAHEAFGPGRHWRIGAALSGLLLTTLVSFVLATNPLSVHAEPLPAFAGRGVDQPALSQPSVDPPGLGQPRVDPPGLGQPRVDQPGLSQPGFGDPDRRGARTVAAPEAINVAELPLDPGPMLPPASSVVSGAVARGRIAPRPARSNIEVAVSDFGGRR